MIQRLCAGPVG